MCFLYQCTGPYFVLAMLMVDFYGVSVQISNVEVAAMLNLYSTSLHDSTAHVAIFAVD